MSAQKPKLKTVLLYGELGQKFGRVHRMAVATAGEAVRALCVNHKGFEQHVTASPAGYRVRYSDELVADPRDLHNPAGPGTIRIIPVMAGAKSGGLGQLLVGAALIGFAWWNPLGWSAIGFMGTTVGAAMTSVGVSLALGGIAQMLAPQPKTPGISERPENKPSYLFDGAVNTTAQGHPVPIGYGRMMVGSAVISAGIYVEEAAA